MDLRTDGTKKKQKRRLPLFDIALLALLTVAIAFGFYWATRHQEITAVELVYTVRLEDVDNAYSGALAQGKTLYTRDGTPIGSILETEITRAWEEAFDSTLPYAEGTEYAYSKVTIPGKSDVLITVRVKAEAYQGGYFASGNRIASGMEMEVMVEGYLGRGKILTVEPAEAEVSAAEVSE